VNNHHAVWQKYAKEKTLTMSIKGLQLSQEGSQLSFQSSCLGKDTRLKTLNHLYKYRLIRLGSGKFTIHRYTYHPTSLADLSVRARASHHPHSGGAEGYGQRRRKHKIRKVSYERTFHAINPRILCSIGSTFLCHYIMIKRILSI